MVVSHTRNSLVESQVRQCFAFFFVFVLYLEKKTRSGSLNYQETRFLKLKNRFSINVALLVVETFPIISSIVNCYVIFIYIQLRISEISWHCHQTLHTSKIYLPHEVWNYEISLILLKQSDIKWKWKWTKEIKELSFLHYLQDMCILTCSHLYLPLKTKIMIPSVTPNLVELCGIWSFWSRSFWSCCCWWS